MSALVAITLSASTSSFSLVRGQASGNPIVVENQLPGSGGWRIGYLVSDDATGQIKGYASSTSVNQNDSITFYVTVNPAQTYTIDIYRMGWYGGLGGRLRLHQPGLLGIHQDACLADATTGLIACHWRPGYSLTIPTDWTSGIYFAVLTNAAGFQNYVTFVVKDGRPAAFLYQRSVATDEAYNNYPNDGLTGKSLYAFNSYGPLTMGGDTRAVKVSFDRPFAGNGAQMVLTWEIQLVHWLEQSGYDVTYSTDIDTHSNGAALKQSSAFLSAGHDEYWSKEMYDAADSARNSGVSLAFFGADEVSWQVRFEPSDSGAPNRVMVCYKDAAIDPVQGPTTTVLWRSGQLNRPQQVLTGLMTGGQVNWGSNADYVVSNSSHWVYAGTGFRDGDKVPGLVGYEMDRFMTDYPAPNSISRTLLSWSPFINWNGATSYANSSIYQAPSGAWVFGTGTFSWSWALDNMDPQMADSRIQKATSNVLNAFVSGEPVVHDLRVTTQTTVAARQAFTVTVVAENARGNPVGNYGGTVHFSSSDTSAGVTLPADAPLTNGQGSFTVTLNQASPQTLTVSDAANALSTTVNVAVGAAAGTRLVLVPGTPTATAGVPFPFAVTAQDKFGNTDPTYAETVHFTTSDLSPGVALPPDTALTNGQMSFSATLHLAGPQTLTVADAVSSLTASATVTVNPGPASHFVLATTSGSTATAGVSLTFSVQAQDQFGNTDHAYAGTIHFASSDTSTGVALPPDSTLANGQGTFSATLDRAGPQTINATDTAQPNITGTAAVAVIAAPATHLALAGASTTTAGTSFSFTVTALDQFGNTDQAYAGTVHFTTSDTSPGVALPPDSTITNGQATFSATLGRAGSQTLTATDTAQASIAGSMTVRVIAASATTLTVVAPSSIVATRAFSIRVTLTDRFGNVATGYQGIVHFTTSDTLAPTLGSIPADYTFTSGDGGTRIFVVSLVTVGSQTVTATDTANGMSGTSAPITVSLI